MIFSEEEIKEAAFQMQPSKVPGLDGMPPFFFQKLWPIVRRDITRAIQYFLSSGKLLKQVNYTHVALVPKQKFPQDMAQLPPINLCSMVFRIASKVLANRLKLVLPLIISQTQNAFVPGWNISDNTIIASEIANYMFPRRQREEGLFVIEIRH